MCTRQPYSRTEPDNSGKQKDMIEIGKIQTLKIAREMPFGVYLCDPADDGTKAPAAAAE